MCALLTERQHTEATLDADQGRRKQKELRKIFSRNFIFLILTFVIVNVQIKGLNFEKPHRGGGPS